MNAGKLQQIRIDPSSRQRSNRAVGWIYFVVILATSVAAWFAWPRKSDEERVIKGTADPTESKAPRATPAAKPVVTAPQGTSLPANDAAASVLTISGYIVARERIELSPRFLGLVKWIGVKKGDRVQKDQMVVQLDDSEQLARLLEIEGQLAGARVGLEKAKIAYERVKRLRVSLNETQEREDEARLQVEAARAQIQQFEGMRASAQVQIDWTVIRAPIDGVVLEKLADPGELVTPQSFGGTRGPSTALLALADPNDLQVEVDVNEADLAKIYLGQRCRVSPEAFLERRYGGTVAEIAPEANRQKGTLQIKVQIEKPDRFLTPELSAKVEFLPGEATPVSTP